MHTYEIQDRGKGRRNRYTVVVFAFYPEAGPPGTPGRGPYCVHRESLPSSALPACMAELARVGIGPQSEAEAKTLTCED